MSYQLSHIFIYPIKSLGGVQLESAKVLMKGIEHDRRWMLIDENNEGMTQRVYPRMALFKISLHNDQLQVTYENEQIMIQRPTGNEMMGAMIWNDPVQVLDAGVEYAKWFSEKLGAACKLVYFPETNTRPVDKRYALKDEQVSLADAYPLLLIGQSSLDDLNSRMESSLPMNRFRPNIVVTGSDPYAEDSWRYFKLGTAKLQGVKPCSRCVLTTVDQDLAIKGKEPLVTLAKYRTRNNKIYFGQNLLVVKEGTIRVGDELVLEDDNYY